MHIRANVSLADHTTFRLGGSARFFVTVRTVPELRDALTVAREKDLPCCVIGSGSNTVFRDEGFDGVVIQIALVGREYLEDVDGTVKVIVSAGENWDVFVAETVTHGVWGLENLSAIPGSVGATPVQNVGAYGVEVGDCIDWVEALNRHTGELHILSKHECAFGYRDSLFKHGAGKDLIITRVQFRLSLAPTPHLTYKDLRAHFGDREAVTIAEVREAVVEIRARKFPDLTRVGTAGSFFKNPVVTRAAHASVCKIMGEAVPAYEVDHEHVKLPAAFLLDRLGWKGIERGHVGTWAAQPLVLVHYGGGTTAELALFAQEIIHDVKAKTGITLEPEVRVV